jgi:hypothetical protein
LPNPEPSGSSDTRPRHERLRSHREIEGSRFPDAQLLYHRNSDEQNSEGTRSFASCPRGRTTRIDYRGFGTYEVLVLMASRTPIAP